MAELASAAQDELLSHSSRAQRDPGRAVGHLKSDMTSRWCCQVIVPLHPCRENLNAQTCPTCATCCWRSLRRGDFFAASIGCSLGSVAASAVPPVLSNCAQPLRDSGYLICIRARTIWNVLENRNGKECRVGFADNRQKPSRLDADAPPSRMRLAPAAYRQAEAEVDRCHARELEPSGRAIPVLWRSV